MSVIDRERYYVQQQEVQAFLVRELAALTLEPGEGDRVVRLFLAAESAYQFAGASNAMQRRLDKHTDTPWSIRTV